MNIFKSFAFSQRKSVSVIRKTMLALGVFFIICALLLGYVSRIPIDEGTEAMYRTLDTLAAIFLVFGILGVLAVAFVITTDVMRKKEFYKTHNRKITHIYAFDVINATLMALFCCCCIYT